MAIPLPRGSRSLGIGTAATTIPGTKRPPRILLALASALLSGWSRGATSQPPPLPLRTAAAALALPAAEAAKSLPVSLVGVVVAAEPDWQGKFFLQDGSGGIYISNLGTQPAIGDRLAIDGVSTPGSFAPIVRATHLEKLGVADLPAARPVAIDRLMAGAEDSQRVEVSGLVRSVHFVATGKLEAEVAIGAYRIRVFPKLSPQLNPQTLVGAIVRVRGTAATSFNVALRQLTAVNVFVPRGEDFTVIKPAPNPPFLQPLTPLSEIGRYRAGASLGSRVHIEATVTFQRLGEDLYLQDAGGGIRVETVQSLRLGIGDAVEAVGFLSWVNFQPVLQDAVVREAPGLRTPVAPSAVTFGELRDGLHRGELIRLQGQLVGRSVRPVHRDDVSFAGRRVILTIQAPELTFTAEREEEQGEGSALTALPLGSRVEIEGVAASETGDDGKLRSLNVLLPSEESFRVLERPSWFTPERLFVGLAVACLLLAGVAGWTITVSKKNAMLSFLVAEREKAQHELQEAHDLLEHRVRERTEQLKVEMSARKAAEVEFRATLTERTRLARELHDTLEQALTGIALQLDTATKLFPRNPEEAGARLELARDFLRQSQVELRRSIWDLRSRELEQFDLAEALAISARQISTGRALSVDLEVVGARKRLPEVVEENLLRIGQEALTNVIKHSGATLVTVRLEFADTTVALEVRDNGSGLDPGRLAGRDGRQFGLLGMSERIKRLGGRFDVCGAPGEGTTVRVRIDLEAVET